MLKPQDFRQTGYFVIGDKRYNIQELTCEQIRIHFGTGRSILVSGTGRDMHCNKENRYRKKRHLPGTSPAGTRITERRTIMGNNRIYLADWSIDGDRVKLVYSDEDIIYVKKVDFDRAFGAIVNA